MSLPTQRRKGLIGFQTVLEVALACGACGSITSFRSTLARALERRLAYAVTIREDGPRNGPGIHPAGPARGRESSSKVASLTLPGPEGWHLEVSLERKEGGRLSVAEGGILEEVGKHLTGIYGQLKTIELLEASLQAQTPSAPVPQASDTPPLDLESLTKREREVVECLRRGRGNATIARRLGISRRTVEKHLENVFAKLKVENRFQILAELNHATS